MCLLFNMLSRFVLSSFSSKEQASFNFMAAVTIRNDFGAQENKICHCFHFLSFYLLWSDGARCYDLSFLNVEFQAAFHSPLSPSSRGSLVPLHFLPLEWYHLYIWGCWYFSWKSSLQLVIHPTHHVTWCTRCKLNKQSENIQPFVFLCQFWPVHCSMSGLNCCFLECIQVSQEIGTVVCYFHVLKNFPQFVIHTVMATHSRILAWRIPQTEETGGLQFIGLQRVSHNWSKWTHTHNQRL